MQRSQVTCAKCGAADAGGTTVGNLETARQFGVEIGDFICRACEGGWEVISRYARRQAIDDGVLVDLMQPETAGAVREAGFTVPVAMTATAFSLAVWPIDDEQSNRWLKSKCQDLQGRLWDVLFMLATAVKAQRPTAGDSDTVIYRLVVLDHAKKRRRTIGLKSMIGPGDDGEPVITIMLPEED